MLCLEMKALCFVLFVSFNLVGIIECDQAADPSDSKGTNPTSAPGNLVLSNQELLTKQYKIEFDYSGFEEKLGKWVGTARENFLNGLATMAQLVDGKNFVAVLNLEQIHKNIALEEKNAKEVLHDRGRLGIWTFKCGVFESDGDLSPENWIYKSPPGGDVFKFNGGKRLVFMHPECKKPAYKPFNHYMLPDKGYNQPNIREIRDVESVEDCAIRTTEVDENVAVYQADTKVCSIKGSFYGRGVTYDRKGNRLGDYDAYHQDIETTKDNSKLEEWIKSGKCDAIHTSKDGLHYCKGYESIAGSTLLFRHRN